jgi:hypothetical protein
MEIVLLISQKQILEIDPKVVVTMHCIQDMIKLQYPCLLETVGPVSQCINALKKLLF